MKKLIDIYPSGVDRSERSTQAALQDASLRWRKQYPYQRGAKPRK